MIQQIQIFVLTFQFFDPSFDTNEEKVEKPVADDIKENDSGLYVALFPYSSEGL